MRSNESLFDRKGIPKFCNIRGYSWTCFPNVTFPSVGFFLHVSVTYIITRPTIGDRSFDSLGVGLEGFFWGKKSRPKFQKRLSSTG